ncbi:MAG TPA: dihydrodipicolinate synthase family protein [Candidatus Limnocylindrales bacterium]|nr:dihydrodipicolinate synthase family protein [Candidatus Limnocylindrales bacterium]
MTLERGLDRDWVRASLTGPMTSVHPVFTREGELDFDGLARCIEHDLAAASGTMLLTYGDSLHSILSDREVGELLRAVVRITAGRAMVVAADRQWPTRIEVEFAREARDTGADLLMVLPPNWGGSALVETLVDHYRTVAAEIPTMIVTAAFAGIQEQGLEVLRILVEAEPRVVALKDDLIGEFARRVGSLCHPAWAIISGGQKQNHLDMHHYGCDGYMSSFLHFNPQIAQRYWRAITANDMAGAAEVIERFDRPFMDRILALPGGFDAGIHATFEAAGLAGRWRRSPYYTLSDAEYDEFKAFLADRGMLPSA